MFEADRIPLTSVSLNEDEQSIFCTLGNRLAEHPKYKTLSWINPPFNDSGDLIFWLDDNHPELSDDLGISRMHLFSFVELLVDYLIDFGHPNLPSASGGDSADAPARQTKSRKALVQGEAAQVFKAFTDNDLSSLKPIPVWWDRHIRGHRSLVGEIRLSRALKRLKKLVSSVSPGSPLHGFYVDIATQARFIVWPGRDISKHRVNFKDNLRKLEDYREWLLNCDGDLIVDLDSSGRLRVVKAVEVPPEFSLSDIPPLDTKNGTWIRAGSKEMQGLGHKASALSTSRSREGAIRFPQGCNGYNCVCGREQQRIWRRDPIQNKVVWYLRHSVE